MDKQQHTKHAKHISIQLITTTIMLLVMMQIAIATPTIDWLTPNQNGEVIDEYPQNIKYVIRGDNIGNCTTTIDEQTYQTAIETTIAEINVETKLTEGTHNIIINCTNSTFIISTQESMNVTINDVINLTKQNENNKKIWLYALVMIILTIIFTQKKEDLYKLLSSTMMLIASIIIYTQTKEIILTIPIIITASMTIMYMLKR